MIELIYQNETAMVYKIQDWEVLRKNYRIIGDLISSTQYIPVLPLRLLPEETFALLSENVATLVTYDQLDKEPDDESKASMNKLEADLLEEQRKLYEVVRRKQVELMIDKIMEGKRKRGDLRSKEDIFEEELIKVNNVNTNNMIWPILLRTADHKEGRTEIALNTFQENNDTVRCKVYYDLWKKGYFITSGYKFGGDFLVYAGDPILYHAIFIVHCLSGDTKPISTKQFVTHGRLSTSVKKTCIFANLNKDGNVDYISSSWMDL